MKCPGPLPLGEGRTGATALEASTTYESACGQSVIWLWRDVGNVLPAEGRCGGHTVSYAERSPDT